MSRVGPGVNFRPFWVLRVELGMEDYGTLLRGVGLLRRPGQWRHVLRLVSAWHWLGRQCVSGPRRTIRRRPTSIYVHIHVGSHGVRSKVDGRRDVARNVMCAAGVRGRDVFSATPDGCLEQ